VARTWAMRLMGHKTEDVYSRYAITCEGDLTEATRKLGVLVTIPGPETDKDSTTPLEQEMDG